MRNRIHAHLVALPAEVRGRIYDLTTKRGIRSARAFDTDTGGVDAARAASIRRLGRQLEQLWDHSRELHAEIRREIRAMGTSLVGLRGMNALGAAKLLAETGDARRFRRRSCFGRFSGTAPIEASSGKVVRHRLSREGNRQVNRVLHTMAVTQLRDDPRAQAFVQRQTSAGATPREGLRALKRHLSNVAFRTMIGDLEEGRVRLELT